MQAFESEAVDYLLKPVERHRLGQTKERLERNQSKATLPDEIRSRRYWLNGKTQRDCAHGLPVARPYIGKFKQRDVKFEN